MEADNAAPLMGQESIARGWRAALRPLASDGELGDQLRVGRAS